MHCDRCDTPHERCTGHKRNGEPCGNWPIDGHDKCRMHAGVKAEQVKQRVSAQRSVATYGLPLEVDPHDALLAEVHRTAGHVQWLGQVIADLDQGALNWGMTREKDGGDDRGTTWEAAPPVWVKLYQDERAHLVRVAKAAIDAGIDERRVRLAEEQGQVIVQVLKATLQDIGVDVTPEVAETVGRHLRAVS